MARRLILSGAVLLLASMACGYRLQGRGDFIPESIHSVGVPTFVNRTTQPELEQRITEEIVRQLQVRGRRETSVRTTGVDAVLEGEVTSYRSLPVEFTADGRARTLQVVITARARLQAATDGKILWAADNFVFRENYPVGNVAAEFVALESVALELVARDFAQAVVTSILEGF
jgi:outer membrane lipopolysaccharide assembly protein LptE/RlpB